MIDPTGFMMIEPRGEKEPSVRDELTAATNAALARAREGVQYRGFHLCRCGVASGNCSLFITIDGHEYLSNLLAGHYMEFHRSEVPERDLELARRLCALGDA